MPSRPEPGDLARRATILRRLYRRARAWLASSPRRGLLLIVPLSLLASAPSIRAQLVEPTRPAALDAVLDEAEARVQALRRGAGAGAPPREVTEGAAARGHVAELGAVASAESAAIIAQLRAELARSRAEVQWLREELEASWRWIEELNAVLEEGGLGNRVTQEGPSPDRSAEARTTPTGEGEAVYHAATRPVNLRAGPRNDAEVLTVVGAGELVRGIGRDGGWLRVRYADQFATEFTGWVHGRFLTSMAASPRWADGSGSASEP
jgi:hypothetical protein